MLINFYTNNEQKAPTVEFFLFTDRYNEMRNGQLIISEAGQHYQVISQLWNDDERSILNVFLQPVTVRNIEPEIFNV